MAATVAALALVGLAGVALADGSPEVRLAKITVAGRPLAHFQGAWADARRGRYYLADQSNASLDTHTNMLVEQITGFTGWSGNADTSGPNGIVSTSPDQLWVADGDSSLKVVDVRAAPSLPASRQAVPIAPPAWAYDPHEQLTVAVNYADTPPFLTYISVIRHEVIGRIHVGEATDGLGASVYSADTNLFYTAIPATSSWPGGEVRGRMLTWCLSRPPHWSAQSAALAVGPGHQLLVGCSSAADALLVTASPQA